MENIKFIIYKGKKYWVSGAGRYFYYCPYKNGVRQKRVALHRQIWKDKNKREIPAGYCVHHINGNTFNNNPDNLTCIKNKERLSDHGK